MAERELIFLKEVLKQAKDAAIHLEVSSRRSSFILEKKPPYVEDELIELEALNSRFARLSDLLIQKLFKTIEIVDLEIPGTARDRIENAAKKGIVHHSAALMDIRRLRNTISHDYEGESIFEISKFAILNTPVIIATINNAEAYCQKFF